MKLTKRGPNYWVDFREPSGKRRRVSTGESDEGRAYAKAGGIVQTAMVAPLAPLTWHRILSTERSVLSWEPYFGAGGTAWRATTPPKSRL